MNSPPTPVRGRYATVSSPILLTNEYQTHVDKLEAENWTLRRLLAGKDSEIGNILASKDIERDVLENIAETNAKIEKLTGQLRLAELNEQRLKEQIAKLSNSSRTEMAKVAEEATLLDHDAEASLETTSLRARVEKLESEKAEVEKELKEIAEGAEQVLQENESLKAELDELKGKYEEAKAELEEMKANDEKEQELEAMKAKYESEKEELQREIENLTEENKRLAAKDETMEDLPKVQELTALIERATEENDKLVAENEKLKKELARKQDAVDDELDLPQVQELADIIEKANEENDRLMREIEALKHEKNDNEEMLSKLEHANELFLQANEEKQQAKDEMNMILNLIGCDDVDAAMTQFETLQHVVDDLRAENEELGRQNDELRKQMENGQVDLNEIEDLKDQITSYTEQVVVLKTENDRLKHELEAHSKPKRRSMQTSPLKKGNSRSEDLKGQVIQLELELQGAKDEIANLKDQLREREAVRSSSSKQDASEVLLTRSAIDSKSLISSIYSDDELEKLRVENENLKSQIQRLSKQKEDIGKLQADNAQLQDQISNLRKSFMSPGSQRRKDAEIISLTQEVAYLKAENAKLQEQLSALRQQLVSPTSQRMNKNEVAKLTQEVADLKAENSRLQDQITAMRRTLVSPTAQKQKDSEINRLNEEIEQLRAAQRQRNIQSNKEMIQRLTNKFSQNMALKFISFSRTVSNSLLKISRSMTSISERIPILIARRNVYPLQNLRKDLVAFISATRDMMQDLHDGANACIRATSSKFRRGQRVYVPLTRDQKQDLVSLEKKYHLGSLINSITDETEVTDGMPFSPIPSKAQRFRLKQTGFERSAELVRAQDTINFLTSQLQAILSALNVSTDIAALVKVRDNSAIARIIAGITSARALNPRVVALIESVRREVQTRTTALSDEHRQLMTRLNC